MTAADLYSYYKIPPQLQQHQLQVTAVGRYLCDHWTKGKINKELVTKALLLHDMGNIVKFKQPFIGHMEKDAPYWEHVQEEFIQKYGSVAHKATTTILQEIGVEKEIVELLHSVGYEAQEKGNVLWDEAKIADYADMCVSPKGVVGFEERMQDLIVRYNLTGNERGIAMRRADLEYIQKHVGINLKRLPIINWEPEIQQLRGYLF